MATANNNQLQNEGDKIKTTAPAAATQSYLRLSEVRDDVVVLKNGGLRAILEVNAINFNLKSEEEQNAIVYSYQNFLNTLEFPLQIVAQSRKLDLDNYLETVREKAESQENALLKQQTEEYISFIKRLLEYADIMEKKFYAVIPYDPYRSVNQNWFQRFVSGLKGGETANEIAQKHQEFEQLNKNLNQRVNIVIAGLEGVGLKVRQLNTKELIEVFYKIYNPLTARHQKIGDIDKQALVTDDDIIAEEKSLEKKKDT